MTSQTECSDVDQMQQLPSDYDSPKICEGCDAVVTDLYIVRVISSTSTGKVERYWHERCLKCCMCGQQMSHKCYEREGRLYCQDDYQKLFVNGCCSHCYKTIQRFEMVMKTPTGHFYHTQCFSCIICSCLLCAGDFYSVNSYTGHIYCQYHSTDQYESGLTHSFSHPSSTLSYDSTRSNQHLPVHANLTCAGNSGNHKSDMPTYLADQMVYWSDDGLEDATNTSSCNKGDKRPRTVLSASQRRVLKHAFDMDPKPSKKARHVMAIETGLTNRVVQVWFQNQRAKMKKRQKNDIFYVDSPPSPNHIKDPDKQLPDSDSAELEDISTVHKPNEDSSSILAHPTNSALYNNIQPSPYFTENELTLASAITKSVLYTEDGNKPSEHLVENQALLHDSSINQHTLPQHCY